MGSAPKGTRDPPEGQLSRAQRGPRGAPGASGTRAQRARSPPASTSAGGGVR